MKELDGTGIVLHDFDGADEQELTVFAEQQASTRLLATGSNNRATALMWHQGNNSEQMHVSAR